MDDLANFVYFHDWYIDTVSVGDENCLSVGLRLDERRAAITFAGTSRCVVEHFSTLNIVYDIKVIQPGESRYAQALALLTRTARTSRPTGRRIAWVTASAGVEIVIEFDSLEIRTT